MNKNIITIGIIVILLIAGVSYTVTAKLQRAFDSTNAFCKKFGISCDQLKKTSSIIVSSNTMIGLISSTSIEQGCRNISAIYYHIDEPRCGNFSVSYYNIDEYGNKSSKLYFEVNQRPDEVERYSNRDLYFQLSKNYGFKSKDLVDWPKFMSEVEALQIFNSLAIKLDLPADMILCQIKLDEKEGIWTAIWLRERNGYRYENDRVLISIMGATGEFIEYVKIYKGTTCPTVVSITEQEVFKMGWERLVKALPKTLQSQAHGLYRAHASLRIVQPNMFGRLPIYIKEKKSRLAWIIYFHFTGGIDIVKTENPSEADWDAIDKANRERDKKWYMLGKPPRDYEVRYDAEDGRILESSYAGPAWTWQFIK